MVRPSPGAPGALPALVDAHAASRVPGAPRARAHARYLRRAFCTKASTNARISEGTRCAVPHREMLAPGKERLWAARSPRLHAHAPPCPEGMRPGFLRRKRRCPSAERCWQPRIRHTTPDEERLFLLKRTCCGPGKPWRSPLRSQARPFDPQFQHALVRPGVEAGAAVLIT